MPLILDNVAQHVALSPAEQDHLLSLMEPRTLKAKTLLLQAGEVCRETYFVTSGILRSYTLDDHAVEHVLNFAAPGWWMADLYSLISGHPGNLYIYVVADAEVLVLPKHRQEEMYQAIPKMERFFRILVENALVAHQQRLMDNRSLTTEQRFEKFCKRFPDLQGVVPQKHIASYIGVTPEFFSKMKAGLLRKGIS